MTFSRHYLAQRATLDAVDLAEVQGCRRTHNQLGFAYQVGFVRLLNRCLTLIVACINEAAIFRSRKRRRSPLDRGSEYRFNEAAIFRSRKPVAESASGTADSCFNEAAVFRSRKLVKVDGIGDAVLRASMRPRSFDRGNNVLQVGRQVRVLASMRPRSFDRGNILASFAVILS